MFNSPMSLQRADDLIHALDLAPQNRVLDLGCGSGAFLNRIAAKAPIKGIGIDNDALLIAEANAAWSAQPKQGDLAFICADAVQYVTTLSAVDVIICMGAEYIFGGYQQLLQAAKAHLSDQGKLLVGTIYWKQPLSAEYLALMDGENPNFDLLTTVQLARDQGFIPLEVHRSSDDEWDMFESYHTRRRYLKAVQSDDPASQERAWQWQRGYLQWGMDTMGFCFLVLQNQKAT